MLRYLFCVLLAPVVVVAAPVHAADTPVEQVNVTITQADLNDPARAGDVYARLVVAAHQACDAAPGYDPATAFFNAECRSEALDEAVRHLDRPALTQLRQQDAASSSLRLTRAGKR